MNGPLGLAGRRCLSTLFLVAGSDFSRQRRDHALALAREVVAADGLDPFTGITSPGSRVIAVRVLSPLVEPAMAMLKRVRAAWRRSLWELAPTAPRSWAV